MRAPVTCFLAERTDLAQESLRRFVFSGRAKCSGPFGHHNAGAIIAEAAPFASEWEGSGADDHPHDDPRWPITCACGYVFTDADEWQHRIERLYRAPNGRLFTTDAAPAGAMWFAPWAEDFGKGPDGKALVVKLPDGTDWQVDSPANNSGTPWQRSGEAPNVTARPSIRSPRYHGFLTGGVLKPCPDSQT